MLKRTAQIAGRQAFDLTQFCPTFAHVRFAGESYWRSAARLVTTVGGACLPSTSKLVKPI